MSLDETRRYLIAYDISDDGRRSRIAKILESFGDRVQFSVFIVDARPARLVRLRGKLKATMVADDSILIADLGPHVRAEERRFEYLGHRRATTSTSALVL